MDGQASYSLLGLQVTEGPPSLNGAPSADVLEENGSQAFMTGLFFTPPPRYAICTCSYANLIFLPRQLKLHLLSLGEELTSRPIISSLTMHQRRVKKKKTKQKLIFKNNCPNPSLRQLSSEYADSLFAPRSPASYFPLLLCTPRLMRP